MISKELLSEVLSGNYVHMKDNTSLNPRGIDIVYCEDRGFGGTARARAINIHELAHKCKEWARGHREYLHTFPTRSTGYICTFRYNIDGSYECYFEADTEPEAIFKACEWILNDRR